MDPELHRAKRRREAPAPLDPNRDAFPARVGNTAAPGAEHAPGRLLSALAWASSRFGALFALFGALASNLARRPLPDTLLPLGETLRRAAMLRPSGLLELGAYLLLASPLLYLLAALRRRLARRAPSSPTERTHR